VPAGALCQGDPQQRMAATASGTAVSWQMGYVHGLQPTSCYECHITGGTGRGVCVACVTSPLSQSAAAYPCLAHATFYGGAQPQQIGKGVLSGRTVVHSVVLGHAAQQAVVV
jgi:hypothetical protein